MWGYGEPIFSPWHPQLAIVPLLSSLSWIRWDRQVKGYISAALGSVYNHRHERKGRRVSLQDKFFVQSSFISLRQQWAK